MPRKKDPVQASLFPEPDVTASPASPACPHCGTPSEPGKEGWSCPLCAQKAADEIANHKRPAPSPLAPTWDAPCTFTVRLETGKEVTVAYEGKDGPLGPGALRLAGPVSSTGFVSHTPREGGWEPIEGESITNYAERVARRHARQYHEALAKEGAKTARKAKGKKT